jgi:beta-mannosidase
VTRLPSGTVIDARRVVWLHEGWQLARAAPDACANPGDLAGAPLEWRDAVVPGTVAAALGDDPERPVDYDASDWWYRLRFAAPARAPGARWRLRFDGLATLADVWLNGEPVLASRNMFVARHADVTRLVADENELVIRFASLERALVVHKRPRPRWRTNLVAQQDLRWFRTTLLGRIPGWTPPVAAVGPWGPVALECVERLELAALRVDARTEGTTGRVKLEARVAMLAGHRLEEARLRIDGAPHALRVEAGDIARVAGEIVIPDAALWWPHTHGAPSRHDCRLELRVDGDWVEIDCGPVGFRALGVDTSDGVVRFTVNGEPVFCRGACWTPLDIARLRSGPAELRAALEAVRDAGANMLRVGGTMTYESADFYRLCDELGILVWQDFMFANMDYPFGDEAFRAEALAEARHQLERLHRHPCIAAYCGGSEIAQQAAMLGQAAGRWSDAFFDERLPALCAELHAGVPYFPSTPWGGALPFHVGSGLAHYYGVGAYRRPIADARAARVKFTPECLAFAQVPDAETTALVLGSSTPPPHHPKWKAGLPRDTGAGWDFEDIRDHYLRELFAVDPVALRSHDLARYYALSRIVPGEIMRRVYAEWRSPATECSGALVWFHRDFVPGAGWGIVDATGRPKAAYWYLKRAWTPRSLHLTDEGLDGLGIHVVNECDRALEATVELEMLQPGGAAPETARQPVTVPARGAVTLGADAMLGYFTDSTWAYRFGPPRHEVVVARLRDADGTVLAEDFHFPAGMGLVKPHGAELRAAARWDGDGRVRVTLSCDRFLQAVSIACDGFAPDDNHFHLAPRVEKQVAFRALGGEGARFKAHFEALNLAVPVTVRAERDAGLRAA